MKYNFNGKEINIPDAEIEKNMKVLEISKKEAIEMWLDDNDYTENEVVEELTAKAKTVKRYEKADKPRKATTKERKVDEEKKRLLDLCRVPIEGAGGIVTNVKNEAEFSFTFGDNCYTVKLVKHRPPKK
jgi:predicted ATP-grasp superfamily ATP-dependent carboligase